MKSLFKLFIITLLLISTSLNASQKQADDIANISAVSLYNIDKNSLQKTIKAYIKTNPNLKALKITEKLSGETFIEFFNKNGKAVYEKSPSTFTKSLKSFQAKAKYENEEVGQIIAFFIDDQLGSLTKQEERWIKQNPAINIAIVDNYPPYDFRDESNKLTGFHSDLIKLMNNNIGTNIKLKPYATWSEAFSAASKGNTHGILSLSWSREREEKYFDYSPPYHFSPYHLVINKDNNSIFDIKDLTNKKVAIEKNTIFGSIISEKNPLAKIVLVDDTKKAYESVHKKETAATISPNINDELFKTSGLKAVSEIFHKSSNLHVGTNKQYPLVSSIIEKAIDSISVKDISYLRQKWLTKDKATIELNSYEKDWIKRNPNIRIVKFFDEPPFTLNGKEKSGYVYELIEYIVKSAGLNIEYIDGLNSYNSMLDSLNKGEVDILTTIPSSLDLGKDSNIVKSKSILKTPFVLIGHSNNGTVDSIESLFDQEVAVVKGYAQDKYLSNFPQIKKVYVNNNNEGFEAIRNGKAKYYVNNRANSEFILNKTFLTDLQIVYELPYNIFPPLSISFAMNKNKDTLVTILEKALEQIPYKKIKSIRDKWLLQSDVTNKKVEFTKKEKSWLEDNPTIRLAYMDYWPIDDHSDNIHTEFVGLLSKYGNINITLVQYDSWKNGFEDTIKGNNVFGILNLSWSKERAKNNFNYTKPYFFTPGYIVVKKSNNTIKSIEDLANNSIYLKEDAITNKIVNELKYNITPINLKNEDALYSALSQENSKANALLTYIYTPELLEKYDLKIANKFFSKFGEVHVGTSKKHKELHTILNKVYDVIPKNELTSIQNKVYKKTKKKRVELTENEKKWLENNPLIKLAMMRYWGSDDNGNNIHTELVKLINKYGNLNIMLAKYNTWKDGLNDASTGNDIHGILNLAWSKQREESYFDYIKGYQYIPHYLVVKKDNKTINNLDTLLNKTVYVKQKHIAKIRLNNFSEKINVIELNNNTQILEQLASSTKDEAAMLAYIEPEILAKYNLKIARTIYDKYNQGHLGINHKHKELISILKKVFEIIPKDELRKIQNKVYKKTSKVKLSKEEQEFIKKHPKIKIHNEKAWAPFNFYEKGRPRGLSIDYIEALLKKVGLEAEFITGPSWNKFIEMSKTKEIDLMLNIVKSPEREKFLNFTNSYSDIIQSVFIKEGSTPVSRIEDLFGKTFVVPKGFYYEEVLKKYPKIKLLKVADTLECIQAVASGKAYAMLDLITVVNYYKNKYNIKSLVLGGTLGIEGGSLPLHMGIRKDWPELTSILNKSLSALSDDEINEIEEKWLFNNTEVKKSLVPLTSEEKKWIRQNRVRVGIEEWAPVIFSHNGSNYDGITGDVLRLIVQKTGLQLDIVNNLWDPLLKSFKNKELDLLPATYYTEERATYGLYSESYYRMLDYIYVKEKDTSIQSMADLKGKTLAIPYGFGTMPKIKAKFPQIEIVNTRDLRDSIQKVLTGEVDALYDGQIAVEYRMQEDLIVGLKAIPQKSFNAAPLHFFSHSDKPILRDIINKALKSIPPYEINKIKSKWLIEKRNEKILDNINNKQDNNKTIWLIVAAVGIFLFLLFILIIITRFVSNDFVAKSFGSSKFRVGALIILSVVIFMLAVLVNLTLSENNKNILKATKNDLEFVLKTTQDRLDTWIEERKNFLLQMGRDNELVEATKALLKVNKNAATLKTSTELKTIREFFKKREKEFGKLGFFIIDKEFISVGSRRDNNLGTKNLIAKYNSKLLERVFEGEAVFIPPIVSDVRIKDTKNEHTMFFAIPIQDKNGVVIAVMTQRLDVEGKFSEIIQSGRIGHSGESYIFSKDGFMLTKSRFRNDLVKIGLLKQGEKEYQKIQLKDPGGNIIEGFKTQTSKDLPFTKMAQSAIALNKTVTSNYSRVYSTIEAYRDYRGVEVFGAWIWYKKYGIGLTTEVDESEALNDFYTLRQNLLIITGLTLLLTVMAVVMLIILGEKATRSIQKANNELNKLLESFDDNVIASKTDAKGIIKYASKAFCEISGYTQQELIGSPQKIVRHPDMPKTLFTNLWATIKSGKSWRGEVKNKKKNGGFYWVDVVIEPEFDEEKNIVGFSAIRQDITSKKEVEELSENLEIKVEERTLELKDAQEQFSSMAANVPGVIYRCKVDEAWTMLYISNEIEVLSGYSVSEFINNKVRTFADIMHEDDKERVSILIQNQIDKGEKFLVDYRVIDNKGIIKWVRSQGQSYETENNENWIDGVLFDVTEQKKLEEEVQASQKRFLTLFDAAPDSISIIKNGEYIDCNQKTLELFGVESRKEFKKTKPSDYSPKIQENGELSIQSAQDKIAKAIETGYNRFEWIHKRLDTNEDFYAEVILSSIVLNDEPHIYAVVRDISERKKAQQKIADQKQYIDSIMNSQSNIVISTDGEKLRTANKAFFDFFEVKDVEEFLKDFGDCICDTFDITASEEFIQKMMGEEKWIEYVYARPDTIHKAIIEKNGIKHIFTITSDRFEFAGEILEVAVFTDITEIENIRKNIETILSNIMLPVLITSQETRQILYANEYASKQYESTIEDLIGSNIDEVYTSVEQKNEILTVMQKNGFVENLEERYKTKTGKEFVGLLSVKPILYNNEDAYIGMVVDITRQKEIEEEVRRIYKHTQSSIEYASLIQHSLIPSNDLFKKYFDDYFTIWHPKDIVGGDIYLFEELRNEDECLLMVIDCTGHGVPGAFVTMLVKAIERQVAAIIASDPKLEVSPAWILKYFNQTMKKLLKQEDDEAISNAGFDGAVLYYNKKEKTVKFAGAEVPLFYCEDGEFKTIKGNRHSIGYKKSDANYNFNEHIIEAKEGMQFYMTTDGYLDQNGGEKGFPFGKKRFLNILEKYKDYSFADQQEVLLNELQEYQKDEEKNDDISIVGIKIGKETIDKNKSRESWVI